MFILNAGELQSANGVWNTYDSYTNPTEPPTEAETEPTTNTVFLKVNSDWAADNARFSVIYGVDLSNYQFVSMEQVDNNIYKANIPVETEFLIFLRKEGTFTGCSSLISVVIPNGIKTILDEAFLDCSSIESIDIPSTVTVIHERAFKNCKSLIEITLPNSVDMIYDSAFVNCTNLKKIVILNDNIYFDDSTFEGSNNLTIYGNTGSNAEKFAGYNDGIPFIPIDIANIIGDFDLELTPNGSVLVGKISLNAGTYNFKVNYLNVDCGSGYEFTDTVANHLYSEKWYSSTTFIATGGEYTFTFDPKTYRLSVSHKKSTYDSVKLVGGLKCTLTKSVTKANEFTNVVNIPAGTYSFKINVDGIELGGTYNYIDEISNARYNTSWKGLTTFTSTGGKYIVTYNVVTNKLTIKKAPVVTSVAITGHINAELTQSATNPEIFTTTMELFEHNYYIDMSVDGVKYGGYHYITNDGSFTYSSKWKNTSILCAKNGTYTLTYNTATNKLTITQVK